MQTNQQSPSILAAIADLTRQGFKLGIHFTEDSALQLRADLADAATMYDRLGRLAPAAH